MGAFGGAATLVLGAAFYGEHIDLASVTGLLLTVAGIVFVERARPAPDQELYVEARDHDAFERPQASPGGTLAARNMSAAIRGARDEEGTAIQVADPVCGMPLDSAKAAATEAVQGQTYYFCSASCHDKFRAAPDRYAKKSGTAKSHGPHCG